MLSRILAALAMVATLASPASATVYTVCPAGPPTCDTDCAGAQAVLTAMNTGDVLELQAGVTCTGLQLSSPVKSGLTVRGVAGGGATLDGLGTTASAIKFYTDITISDLTVTGYTGTNLTTIGGDRRIFVSDVSITGGATCIGAIGAGSVIDRAQCLDQSSKGIDKAGVAFTLKNSVVRGSGAEAVNASGATCEHLTVAGTQSGPYAVRCLSTFGLLLSGNTNSIAAVYTGTGTHSYNLIYGSSTADCSAGCGTGSIIADPLLVSGTDLHLTPGSPAIGMPVGSTATVDVEGNARDANPDAGAFELTVTGPAPGERWLRVGTDGTRTLRVGTDGTRTKRVQ